MVGKAFPDPELACSELVELSKGMGVGRREEGAAGREEAGMVMKKTIPNFIRHR
jgi:hypothetical protein